MADMTSLSDGKNKYTVKDANAVHKDTAGKLTEDLNLGGHKIIEVSDPIENTDAANKQYVDEIKKYSEYTPEYAKGNVITDVLGIDTTGNFEPAYMKAGIIATEDASTLVSSPVTSGAFYAYREVFYLPNRAIVGNTQGKTIVRLTEAWPCSGRMWINSYNVDTKSWSSWCEHYSQRSAN